MTKSISLVLGANRATLSGPKSKQYRIRQNANAFAKRLRRAGFGVRKWTNITNKHFAAVARQMQEEGKGGGRIAEIFSAARDLCKAYGNTGISPTNDVFDVRRGSIANANSKAVAPVFVQGQSTSWKTSLCMNMVPGVPPKSGCNGNWGSAAKNRRKSIWSRTGTGKDAAFPCSMGPRRDRTLYNLSDKQQDVLERALPWVSQSDRAGIHKLMPEGMGDKWQEKLSYAAKLCGFTKEESGWTLHGNRHERFHRM